MSICDRIPGSIYMNYSHQNLQIKRNLFSVKVRDKWRHKRRHYLLMTLRSISYMHCLTHWSGMCWKCRIEKIQLIWIILVPKRSSEDAYPHLMFLSKNKKVIGVWTFEVSCIKWMEKSEVIQKTLRWKYRLISITSDWYDIISLVIDITFICFWYALISLLSIK